MISLEVEGTWALIRLITVTPCFVAESLDVQAHYYISHPRQGRKFKSHMGHVTAGRRFFTATPGFLHYLNLAHP